MGALAEIRHTANSHHSSHYKRGQERWLPKVGGGTDQSQLDHVTKGRGKGGGVANRKSVWEGSLEFCDPSGAPKCTDLVTDI